MPGFSREINDIYIHYSLEAGRGCTWYSRRKKWRILLGEMFWFGYDIFYKILPHLVYNCNINWMDALPFSYSLYEMLKLNGKYNERKTLMPMNIWKVEWISNK